MADLTLRLVKGSPLTNEELDANFSNLNEGQTIAGEPMGHEDKTQSVLSFNASTRTVTVAPAGSEFVVWCKGEKYVFTAAQTVVIPNTTGIHYVYFSDAGVLSSKLDYFDWHQDAPTAYVYWNATTGAAPFFADERHGITLDWQTHEYLHRTRGAALANGFSIGNYTVAGDGSLDAHAQLDIAGGTFFDEDLKVQIVSTNTPTANTWEQDLAGPARIPVMYRSGDAWVIDSPTNFILKAGTATPRYNSVSGDVWGLTDTPNNSYSSVWVVATNNLTYPVIAIMGQAADNNSGDIEALEWSSLNLDGFPAVEFRPLYKVIFKAASGAANTVKAYFTAVFDVRGLVSAGPSATIGSSHGGLSGLGNDDHTQYLHVSEVRSPSAAVLASFLPAQTGNSGKFLTTNGTASSWATMTAPNNGTLTLATSGSGISGSASFTADQATGSTFTVTLNSATANSNNTIVLRDGSGNFAANAITANTFTGALSGNASTASTLATARSITASGDLAWTVSFDGSAAVSAAATLAASGVIAGAYGSAAQTLTATVDAKGRVTAMSAVTSTPAFSSVTGKPTTLAGYGITDAQGLDADLTAIAALAGTSGFLKKTAANSWTLDTSTYITGITSSMVTTALGFTPYNATNPSGFITSSGSISGSAGSVSGLTLTSSANGINPDNVTQNQIGYNTSVSLFGQTDGGLYSSAYSSSWIHQIYGDFRTGQIATRGKNNGTWQPWRIQLDSSNYTSYSPSLTGSGASGTWGISVTGSAGSIVNNTSPKFRVITFTGDGGDSGNGSQPTGYGIYQQGGAWTHPYPDLCIGFHTGIKIGAYYGYNGTRFYNNSDWATEIFSVGNGDNNIRAADTIYAAHYRGNANVGGTGEASHHPAGIYSNGTNWLYGTIYTNGNGIYAGGAYSEVTAYRANRANGNFYIDDNHGYGIVGTYSSYRYQGVFAMGDSYKLPADGTSLGTLYGMAWSHPNAGGAAGNLTDHGLLIINNGGFRCAISNSIVASANITAYSDERLKKNWRPMPENYVARLAEVKVGIYDRIDEDDVTQVGVSAQSFRDLLPSAIMTAKDDMGTLSVSYGNAALASAVELAKDNVELRARIERLESIINKLLGDQP